MKPSQKTLNVIGIVLLISSFLGFAYYFAAEFRREKAEVLKHQRMLFIKDSLQVEESLINLKQLHMMENETDTVMFRPRF